MTSAAEHWAIEGAKGETVLGTVQPPMGAPRGTVIIAHGFKGYQEYGMFPAIARAFVDAGFIAHRFNFSHSGMTRETERFAREDLFERDTWNRQVEDLEAIAAGLANGELAGGAWPCLYVGHSRGGVATLLAAGRVKLGDPAGLATIAAPSRCNTLTPEQIETIEGDGVLVSPSSRTSQDLLVGRGFLQEQLDAPADHDLLALCGNISCPALVVHGADDPTVPAACAKELAAALGAPAERIIVDGADHVFNTPNPFPADGARSPQLEQMLTAVVGFAERVCVR